MRIVIPGGSGQVGTVLARAFHQSGDDVVVLSRRTAAKPWRVVTWDGKTMAPWAREIDDADVVINLTGRSVNCRYNAANRRDIVESRVDSTRVVGEAIAAARRSPRVWLQASTATIYAHRFDAANDERTGLIGAERAMPDTWQFSIDVVKAWEHAFDQAATPAATRKITLRSAMMMSADRGGIFERLVWLVRRGIGGPAGDGRQFMSWIHGDDMVAAVRWLIAREDLSGVVNVTSPNPLANLEFMRDLRSALGISAGLGTPAWLLEIGAIFLRTETELILKSRRVVPTRLLESGFRFMFPDWPDAARDLCRHWRASNNGHPAGV